MSRRITFILFLIGQVIWAQTEDRDFEKELNYQSKAVQNLKNEIESTRKKLRSEENREKSAARTITNLEKEISLVERLIFQLKKEEIAAREEIAKLENEIEVHENELKELRIRYANRAINVHKKGSLSEIEKVLSSTSWRQAIYRTKYQKIISGIDQKHKKQIRSLLVNIGKKKLNVQGMLLKSISLKAEREKQMTDLRMKRQKKKRELDKIRNSKTELAQYVREKEEGVKQLEELIANIKEDKTRTDRAERIRRQKEALKTKSFVVLKGQLSWPARGKVISKFGRKWNPELKTTTNNTGIDIKGKPGTQIYAVMGGIVTTITFIRGYGNIIIIDHGGGFSTVYAQIDNITVHENEYVQMDNPIASVANPEENTPAKLHFEVWGNQKKLNPEHWLTKK